MVEISINSTVDENSDEMLDNESLSDEDSPRNPNNDNIIHIGNRPGSLVEANSNSSPLLKTQMHNTSSDFKPNSLEDDEETLSDDSTTASKTSDKHTKATNYVSIFMMSSSLFTMIAIYLGGLFLELFPKTLLFKLTLILCVIPFVVVFLLYEQRRVKPITGIVSNKTESKDQQAKSLGVSIKEKLIILKHYLKQGFIIKPVIFIFLVLLTPSIDSVMFSYQATELKFTPTFMSYISIGTSLSNILAIFLYRQYLHTIGLKTIITFTTIGFSIFNAMKLLIVFDITQNIGIDNHISYMAID